MELKWLEDFLSLYNTGSFRASSEQRCVSQPAFSRRIKSLESWLGADLFDRTRYPVCPTRAGLEFRPIAEQIVRLSEQARNDVVARTRINPHSLNIATLQTLAQFFVPGFLKRIELNLGTGPVHIRTDFRSVEDYLSALEDQLVDFFVCYDDASGSNFIDHKIFPVKRLGCDELLLVSTPDEKGTARHALPDSGPCSLLQYSINAHLFRPIRNHVIQHFGGVEFVPTHEAATAAVLKAMCLQGSGMAWLPLSVVSEDLGRGRLVQVSPESGSIPLRIVIYRSKHNTEPHVERIWNAISESSE